MYIRSHSNVPSSVPEVIDNLVDESELIEVESNPNVSLISSVIREKKKICLLVLRW